MERWIPYLFVYGVGGAVFAISLVVAWRRGALRGQRHWLAWLLLGLALYAGGHALLQAQATPGAFPAAGEARGADGVVGSTADLVVLALYFALILGAGTYVARHTRTTSDFFFGGRRFAWWLVAVSCVATTVGAYSFVKYSAAGFSYGLASTMSYLNDWFWMPLWMLIWLPIIYYGRVRSVPEYFERRFGPSARRVATVILLVYLVGYIAINFLTLGKAMHALTGWPIFTAACVAAATTGLYVSVGGQTSVIMTDLIQGFILLIVGLGLFGLGVAHVGGFDALWAGLPLSQRAGLAPLTTPAGFNTMGVFWQDAMAGGVAFYFMNQGILMRFMSARSVEDGRKAVAAVVLIVMPLAAIAVGGAGWIGRAMVHQDTLASDIAPDNVFVMVASVLTTPGVFGLVMATLTAALMSTADTLLTAVSAVVVNDVWRPLIAEDPDDDAAALQVARWTTIGSAFVAVALVPVFMNFKSIYLAHAAFVAAIVPPMAVALVLGATWRRYGHAAALVTLLGGSAAIFASLLVPELIEPFALGTEPGGEGIKAYKFMRAFYGLVISGVLGVIGAYVFPHAEPDPRMIGGPLPAMRDAFKGGTMKPRTAAQRLEAVGVDGPITVTPGTDEVEVRLHADDRAVHGLEAGDLVWITRPGRLHGGLHAMQGRVATPEAENPGTVEIPAVLIKAHRLTGTLELSREG